MVGSIQRRLNKRAKYIRILFFITFIVTCVALIINGYFLYLAKPLMGYGSINVVLDDNLIDIKEGDIYVDDKKVEALSQPLLAYKSYSLANFYITSLEDPLFVDENFDKEVSRSLELTKTYQDIIKDEMDIEDDFIPVTFLSELPSLSRDYGEFINSPTHEGALGLIRRYEEVNNEYLNSVNSLIKNIDINTEDKQKIMSGTGGATTPEIILSDLELMKENGDAIQREIRKRKRIINGVSVASAILVDSPKIQEQGGRGSNDILERVDLFLLPHKEGSVKGPYYVSTPCFGGDDSQKPFYIYEGSLSGRSLFITKYASENYYYPIEASPPSYGPIPDNRGYNCNSQSYQVELLTLDGYYQQYPKQILNTNNAFRDHNRKIEEEIYTNKKDQFGALVELEIVYREEYLLTKKDNEKKALLGRIKYISNQTDRISLLFNETFGLNSIANSITKGDGIPEKEFIYTIRSNYSSSYLSDSKAVWRIDKEMSYLTDINEHMDKYRFTELIKKHPREEISSWGALGVEIMRDLEEFEKSVD